MKYFLTVIASAILMFAVSGCEDETDPPVVDVADVAVTEETTDVVETEEAPETTESDAAPAPADVSPADATEDDAEASD